MAEIVELNIEDTIPGIELMKKLHLFSKSEILNIMRSRKQFEYKLQRLTKHKEDLISYIHYEMNLLKMVRQRMNEKGMNSKKNNVEYSIITHVIRLYQTGIRRFPQDVRIWLSFIKFCKQVGYYTHVSRLFDQMIELHGAGIPSLFKLAAQWEWDENRSIERCRKFIHQGLHLHKDSRALFIEGFKLELAYANAMREKATGPIDDGPEGDPVLRGKLAEVVYESAVKKINNDVMLLVELLNISEEFKFTSELQNKIIEGLKNSFPDKEVTWDTLARRELELAGTFKDRIEKCIAVYQHGIERIPSLKMWGLYMDYVLELNEDSTTLPNFKKNCLKNSFDAANKAHMLSEKHYLLWIKKVPDVDSAKVLRWGTERFPDSLTLWTWRLRYHLSKGDEVGALSIFNQVKTNNNIEGASLWLLMLKYYQMTDPPKGENLWKEGVMHPVVGGTLKPKYIEWLAVSRGINAARKAYTRLVDVPPYCLDLHLTMSKLEDAQPKLSLKTARQVYENEIRQFGESNTDVWMGYIRFEEKFGDAHNVPIIFERATKTLRSSLVDGFVFEFNLSKTDQPNRVVPSLEKTPSDELVSLTSTSIHSL